MSHHDPVDVSDCGQLKIGNHVFTLESQTPVQPKLQRTQSRETVIEPEPTTTDQKMKTEPNFNIYQSPGAEFSQSYLSELQNDINQNHRSLNESIEKPRRATEDRNMRVESAINVHNGLDIAITQPTSSKDAICSNQILEESPAKMKRVFLLVDDQKKIAPPIIKAEIVQGNISSKVSLEKEFLPSESEKMKVGINFNDTYRNESSNPPHYTKNEIIQENQTSKKSSPLVSDDNSMKAELNNTKGSRKEYNGSQKIVLTKIQQEILQRNPSSRGSPVSTTLPTEDSKPFEKTEKFSQSLGTGMYNNLLDSKVPEKMSPESDLRLQKSLGLRSYEPETEIKPEKESIQRLLQLENSASGNSPPILKQSHMKISTVKPRTIEHSAQRIITFDSVSKERPVTRRMRLSSETESSDEEIIRPATAAKKVKKVNEERDSKIHKQLENQIVKRAAEANSSKKKVSRHTKKRVFELDEDTEVKSAPVQDQKPKEPQRKSTRRTSGASEERKAQTPSPISGKITTRKSSSGASKRQDFGSDDDNKSTGSKARFSQSQLQQLKKLVVEKRDAASKINQTQSQIPRESCTICLCN